MKLRRVEKQQVHNKSTLLESRKQLRNNGTPEEKLLWDYLKRSQTGYKFRRQHSVKNMILDFYCPEVRLAIEVDGAQHFTDEGIAYDAVRTEELNLSQIQVLRFTNTEVKQNPKLVVEKIVTFINELK